MISSKWRLFARHIFIEIEDEQLKFYHRTFPYFGKLKETACFPIDKIIFCGNDNDRDKSKRLFISMDGRYDSLPSTSNEMALDDKDDWTLEQFNGESSQKDLDADLYMYTSTICVPLNKQSLAQVYDFLEEKKCVKATVRKASGIINQQYVAYSNDWLFHFKTKLIGKLETDSTPIREMAFFVENKKNIYCGYHRQVIVNVNSQNVRKELKQHCESLAPRLKETGDTYKSSWFASLKDLFNPSRWFFPDRLTLTDNAVLYTRKTLRKDEMTYLPYRRINLFLIEKGLLTRRVEFYGEQNIVPRYSFKRKDVVEIEKKIQAESVPVSNGSSFKSSKIFHRNWLGKGPRILCFDDNFVYYPCRLKRQTIKTDAKSLRYDDITEITWHRGWFKFFGTLVIQGKPENIRLDQSNNYILCVLPDVWMFRVRWFIFRGELYDILKTKSHVDIKVTRSSY